MATSGEHIKDGTSFSNWLLYCLLLFCGFLIRIWFVTHAPHITGDTVVYGGIARNWLEHGVYSFTRPPAPPRPTLIRLPGYPLFLAICFRLFGMENYRAVLLVQVAVDLITCVLVTATARRLFSRRASFLALALACFCPFTASYTAQPLTETLTLFCIAAAFYALLRWLAAGSQHNRWLIPLSASLAYAILLRPEQGLLAAAVLPAMLWRTPRRLLPVLLTAALTLLPLLPWTVRNYRTFHILQPLAPRSATDPGELIPAGFQRWFRTWAVDFASTEDVYWNYDGNPIAIADLPRRAFDTPAQYAMTTALLDDYNETSNATPALEARFNALAVQRIRAHPVRYILALPLARVANMLFRPRTENTPWPTHWWRFHQHARQSVYAVAYAGLNFIYYLLAVLGFRRWQRSGRKPHPQLACSMLAIVLLRLILLLTLDNSEPRYTLEFFPILVVFASALVVRSDESN